MGTGRDTDLGVGVRLACHLGSVYIAELAHKQACRTSGEIRDVKVRSSVKPICEHCKVVKRQGVVRIICKRSPKHKQRQG